MSKIVPQRVTVFDKKEPVKGMTSKLPPAGSNLLNRFCFYLIVSNFECMRKHKLMLLRILVLALELVLVQRFQRLHP